MKTYQYDVEVKLTNYHPISIKYDIHSTQPSGHLVILTSQYKNWLLSSPVTL